MNTRFVWTVNSPRTRRPVHRLAVDGKATFDFVMEALPRSKNVGWGAHHETGTRWFPTVEEARSYLESRYTTLP